MNAQMTIDTDWDNLEEVFKLEELLLKSGYNITDVGCNIVSKKLKRDIKIEGMITDKKEIADRIKLMNYEYKTICGYRLEAAFNKKIKK